jgi:hypothetical protein
MCFFGQNKAAIVLEIFDSRTNSTITTSCSFQTKNCLLFFFLLRRMSFGGTIITVDVMCFTNEKEQNCHDKQTGSLKLRNDCQLYFSCLR